MFASILRITLSFYGDVGTFLYFYFFKNTYLKPRGILVSEDGAENCCVVLQDVGF